MNGKRKFLIGVFAAALAVVCAYVVFLFRTGKSDEQAPVVSTSAPKQQTETESEPPKMPDEIAAIKNNNISGAISSIDDKSLVLATGSGDKKFNVTKGTFVVAIVDNSIGNKKLSDLKKGMKVYVQFDPETEDAETITLE